MTLEATLLTDILLVDRCIDGEEAATRALFRQYQRRMHATLYRVLGNGSELDDLMQDAFIEVFKSLPNYRGEAKLSTWIDRITVRVAFRYIRRKKKAPVASGGMDDFELFRSRPSAQAASREGIRRLYEVLSTLPVKARVAFALHEIDGRSIAEVADIVGAAQSATKLRVWRARRAIYKIAASDPVLSEFLGDSWSESQGQESEGSS